MILSHFTGHNKRLFPSNPQHRSPLQPTQNQPFMKFSRAARSCAIVVLLVVSCAWHLAYESRHLAGLLEGLSSSSIDEFSSTTTTRFEDEQRLSELSLDDSRLSRTRRVLDDIATRIDVEEETAAVDSAYFGGIHFEALLLATPQRIDQLVNRLQFVDLFL